MQAETGGRTEGVEPVAAPGPSRNETLERMTQALEAAKHARDRGANVQVARQVLKEARSAFERGNYALAIERANYLLGLFGDGALALPPTPSPGPAPGPSVSPGAQAAIVRVAEATETVKLAKAHGFNIQVAKAALKQAKKALKRGDYAGAMALASQAIELSGSTGRTRP